jgi:hypothetical protein
MKVSIWVGHAPSWELLDEALTFTFTEDGEAIPCPFGEAYGIDWFDEDFREASVNDSPTLSVRDLLARHTSGTQIAETLDSLGKGTLRLESNAIVLLYDFEYSGKVKTASIDVVSLEYIGTVDIDEVPS